MAYITKEDVYRVTGLPTDGSIISDNDIDMNIESAESYVEKMLGTCFQIGGRAITETLDGNGRDTIFLNYYPLITLSSLSINGTSVTPSKVYQWNNTGKLQLKTTAEVTKFDSSYPQLVSITYTYGEEPDERVKHFTASLAAFMTLIAQVGGTFDDVTTFTIPEMSGTLGEPYTNIRETMNMLLKQMDSLKPYMIPKPQFG